MLEKQVTELAKASGVDGGGFIEVSRIPFRMEFRAMCEANRCGKYDKSWMCPPQVGPIEEVIAEAQKRKTAFVFQTIWDIRSSLDIKGMKAAGLKHGEVTVRLAEKMKAELDNPLILGAGACPVCGVCAKVEDQPCRFPDMALASHEAHGISVSELAKLCGLKYVNGTNTITYFGAALFGSAR